MVYTVCLKYWMLYKIKIIKNKVHLTPLKLEMDLSKEPDGRVHLSSIVNPIALKIAKTP